MILKFINSGTKMIVAFMLLLSNTMAFGQYTNSDMVFLKDNNLCTILKTIITPENTCDSYSNAINWYVEFKIVVLYWLLKVGLLTYWKL